MTKRAPFFSVIIPTHERVDPLARALRSVVVQDDSDFEVLIMDDGSSEETYLRVQSLVEDFADDRIQLHRRARNLGVAQTRNELVALALGQWLAFLDSDDEWKPSKLSRQKEFIQGHPEIKWVHANEEWLRRGEPLAQKKKHRKGGGDQFFRSIELCIISPSCVVIEKSFFEQAGGFDPEFTVCEDYDLWLRMSAKAPIGFVEDPLVIKHGGHDDQLSHRYHSMDFFRLQALAKVLKCELSEAQERAVLQSIDQRCRILRKGMLKHHRLTDYGRVLEMQRLAQSRLQKF